VTAPRPGIGLAATAAANAVDSSDSTSSSPTAHLSTDRSSLASQPSPSHGIGGVAALLGGLPKAQPNKPPPPPGLGGLPGLPMPPIVPQPATAHAAAPTSAAMPGMANGTSKGGTSATAALNDTAGAPLSSQPPLAWPSLPSALHDVFGSTPAGGSSNPAAPPRANANATELHATPATPLPPRPVPMAPPLFPGFGGAVAGGTDWGAAAFGNGVFGGTPLGAVQPHTASRTQSLPVPPMPPSLFPFNAAGWSGGSGDGWGSAGAPLVGGASHGALVAEPNSTWPGAPPLVGDPSQARTQSSGGAAAGGNYSLF